MFSGLSAVETRKFYLAHLPDCVYDQATVPVCTRAKVAAQARKINKQFARRVSDLPSRLGAVYMDASRHFRKYFQFSATGPNIRQRFEEKRKKLGKKFCEGEHLFDCEEVCKALLKSSMKTNKGVNTLLGVKTPTVDGPIKEEPTAGGEADEDE